MAAYLRAVASGQPWDGITPDLIEVARWAISEHKRAEKLTRKPLQPPSPYYLGLCRHLRALAEKIDAIDRFLCYEHNQEQDEGNEIGSLTEVDWLGVVSAAPSDGL